MLILVSILVLVDVALVLAASKALEADKVCFNPCFSGCRSCTFGLPNITN
ncbi:MAG: hypothetical protein SRB2_04122 [Desulfobacteraceae bacterium Eth-SRB2]|nr:MAG: hypothetical protein SRB2_04122 [Desulfobacteraceae bacterium Eth-SRB2]